MNLAHMTTIISIVLPTHNVWEVFGWTRMQWWVEVLDENKNVLKDESSAKRNEPLVPFRERDMVQEGTQGVKARKNHIRGFLVHYLDNTWCNSSSYMVTTSTTTAASNDQTGWKWKVWKLRKGYRNKKMHRNRPCDIIKETKYREMLSSPSQTHILIVNSIIRKLTHIPKNNEFSIPQLWSY